MLRPSIFPRPGLRASFDQAVKAAFESQAHGPVLLTRDLRDLPAPAQRYIASSGALGRPRPQSLRIKFDAVMRQKPGAAALPARSDQFNFFADPTRLFFMRARLFGLPVGVFHAYGGGDASMRVRVAGLFNAVDIRGPELFQAETVTYLNDLCLFAPGALVDPRISWKPFDSRSCELSFRNGAVTVRARLFFNDRDELVNFVSDDRLALGADGKLHGFRFSTPIRDYGQHGGLRLPSHGDAVWHYPEGNFVYGSFDLRGFELDPGLPGS